MKNCSNCNQNKPSSDFFKNKARRDGLSNMCQICERKRKRKIYYPSLCISLIKICSSCGKLKSKNDFRFRYFNSRGLAIYRAECESCFKSKNRIRQTRTRRVYKKERSQKKLWLRYHLTIEQYVAILKAQDNKCSICKSETPGGTGRWHIDHNHSCCPGGVSCGKCIRGFLCASCNLGLGNFKDSSQILKDAASYLENYYSL